MDSRMDDILGKLTYLHKKEYAIQTSMRKSLKEPCSMENVRLRIRNESKLKNLRREIEQEEYNLEEAKILMSLETR